MLRVPITQARAGMELALPVLQPKRPGVVLLHAGVRLDRYEIERMREIEIREVWIRVPGLELIAQYVNPELVSRHAALTRLLSSAFDSLREHRHATLEFEAYRDGVAGLVESIYASPRAGIFVQELADRESDFIRHASSVSLISLLMGIKLDAYLISERRGLSGAQAKSVINLGLGAMLHDVGMLRLSPETLDRWHKLRDEKDPAWRQHVQLGFDMVQGQISPTAAAAMLHHHQKHDGTGFPERLGLDGKTRPLAGNEIHVFARVIACADLFDRERHPVSAGSAQTHTELPVVRALSNMLRPPVSRWVDPVVLRALLAVVPAYAPGIMVRLNTGQRAAVCNWFADDPCRPSVIVLGSEDGEASDSPVARRATEIGNQVRAEHLAHTPAARIAGDRPRDGDRVDLKSRPDLTITHAEGVLVADDNFYPSYPGEFDLNLGGSKPFDRPARAIAERITEANAA